MFSYFQDYWCDVYKLFIIKTQLFYHFLYEKQLWELQNLFVNFVCIQGNKNDLAAQYQKEIEYDFLSFVISIWSQSMKSLKTQHTNIELLINRSILELKFEKTQYQMKSTPTLSLRGGGCIGSKAKTTIQMQNKIPMNYLLKMKINSQLLVDKCDQLLDNFSRNEIMMSLQWFSDNRYWICEICKNDNLILMLYDLALNQFRQLISVISVYLRGSGCLCYYVLEVCNDLLLIIYTYQLNDEKRFLLFEVHGELLSMIDIIKQDLEVHKNFWTNGLEFQITLIKTVLINSRKNSKEQQDKLISIASSAFSSLLSLSISEDFTSALFDFAKYLLIEKYNKFSYPIQTYQIYYFFFLLKWNIIKNIQEKNVVNKQIANLQLGYEQYVQNSDNWIVHFCWINAMSDLISYRQIISKAIFLKNQDDMKQKQLWNQLIQQNIIKVLPYDKLLGKVNNSCSFKPIDYETEKILNGLGLKKMKFFQTVILNQKFANKQNFFQFYVDFTFQKLKKPEEKNNLSTRFELFGVDKQMKKLQRLYQLLKEMKEKVSEYILKVKLNHSNYLPKMLRQKITQINREEGVQQLDISLFKLSYLLNERKREQKSAKNKLNCMKTKIKKKNKIRIKKIKINSEVNKNSLKIFIMSGSNQIFQINTFKFLISLQNQEDFTSINLKLKKTESKQQKNQIQIQENDLILFIQDAQIQIEKFLQELNISQQQLQNFWRLNNKLTIIKDNELLDQKRNEFFFDIIEWNKLSFPNDEYHKEFKELLTQQKFQTLEDIQKFDLKIQNYIKMMKILKGQNMQKAYIFSKLEFNIKFTLEIKNSQEHIQLDNNQKQEISINELILEQKKDIEAFLQNDIKDKSGIQKILEQILTLRNKIIVNFASQQNSLECSALILQNKLYNLFYQISFSSQQDIEQCKKEILEQYQILNTIEYQNPKDQTQTQNDIKYKNTQDQIQNEGNEQNEYLKLISKKISELNNQIIIINKIIVNMEELSQYVHQNCMGFQYLTEDHFQKHFLDHLKLIIKELINHSELDKLLNELINDISAKQQNQGNQLINKQIFTLKDFATIFCQNQTISDKAVQIDKDYQELLDNLEQEMIMERKIYDLNKDYIVRQCFLFHLIKIQSQVPETELLLLCQEYLRRIWMIEKDESVRAFLKNKEIIEIQKQLFSHNLKTFSANMKEEMNQKLKEMDDIEQVIRFEGNPSKRDELSKQLQNKYEEFEEFLDNISEMSQQLDISLIFLQELQKKIKQIKKNIDDLQESINEIGNDVRKLRGKKYEELFKTIFSNLILYTSHQKHRRSILLQDKPKALYQLLIENIKQNKIEGREGEVNQFIYDEQLKDVMLIKGQAGSGKSRAARKIEVYLWKQKQIEEDWIPIYISLPQLKNPKFALLDQALESENYGFDKLQLKEFKEAIQNNKIRVVMILDSYDEMKQDCIQSNLILTNRLIQDFTQMDQEIKKIKFIITTRKEILTSLGYQTWFYGESLFTLKEIEIMSFDEKQNESYLKHYVKLSIKRRIKSSYDFVKQIKKQSLDINEFLEIWKNILDQVADEDEINENSNMLLTNYQIENIVEILKKQPAFQYVQDDQLMILKKELKDLWSAGLFNKTIQNLSIQHFLQTPFMLEIVVQTLPSLQQKYKETHEIKEMFQKNYLLLKSKENKSKKLLSKFIYKEQQKEQVITKENKFNQSETEEEQEDQQNLKSLQIIVDQLESQRFFENYSITDISQIKNQIINISDDDLKILIAALKMKVFTIYEFYQHFIEFYHEQQIQKLRQLGKVDNVDSFTIDLLQFSESLAIEMTMNQTTQVNYEQKGRLKLKNHYFNQNNEDDWKMHYFDDLEDEYRKLVRSSALINVKGKSYTFNHKSLQEFYVAKHINNLIDKLEFIDNNKLTEKSVNYLEISVFNKKEFNISQENYLGSLSILKEKLKLKNESNLKLISIAKLSAKEIFKVASSNSFCLLSFLQVYIGEQDFSGIQIEKTTLKGLSFYKSILQQSIVIEVIIDSCLFDQANLEKAKWTNMICSEKPLLEGHKGGVVVIQYSNDGKLIASGDSEKVVKFWDIITFQQEGEINDISGIPQFLVFSADDQLLFVGDDTNIIESWQISNLKEIIKSKFLINKQEQIILMQLSSNEKELLVVDRKGLIQFWDVNLIKTNLNEKDGFILKNSDSQIKFISFFKNGEMLASASEDQKVTLWDVIEQKVLATIEIDFPITFLAINQTSEFLVCVSHTSKSKKFSVWNIENINQPYLLRTSSKYRINNIQFTTDNQQSIENLGDTIQIQKISNICIQEEYLQIINCTCIDFSPDEILIATSHWYEIQLWSLETKTPMNEFQNYYTVDTLLFFEKGKKLLCGNYLNGITLWSVEKCQFIYIFSISYTRNIRISNIQNITISSNSDRMAIKNGKSNEIVIISLDQLKFNSFAYYLNEYGISISQNDQLFVFKKINGATYVRNLENNQQIEFENGKNNFEQCVFSHQSSLFASFNKDQKLQIWTYEGGKFSLKYEKPFDYKISCMIFSFDDKYLAMTSEKNVLIKIWDFSENQIYNLEESINQKKNDLFPDICFSCDSLYVSFFNNDEITIWKFISDQTATIFKDDNSTVRSFASSPKQNIFATSSNEFIKFWNFETQQLLHSFFTGQQTNCLCFTYNGNYLISAGSIVKLWDISNFPQIKLCAATQSRCILDVTRICCLHQTQGILLSCALNSEVIQFDQFKFLGVLEGSGQSWIQCQFSADSRVLVGGIGKKVVTWKNDKHYEIESSFEFPDIVQSKKESSYFLLSLHIIINSTRLFLTNQNFICLHNNCQYQEFSSDNKFSLSPLKNTISLSQLKRLVVAISSGIYILNVKSSNLFEIIPNLKSAYNAKMFQNDKYLFTTQYESVKIWRKEEDNQFTLIDYYNINNWANNVFFSQDGKYIAKRDHSYDSFIVYPIDLISKKRFIFTKDQSTIRISNNSQYLLQGNYQLSKLSNYESGFTIEEFSDLGYFEFCPDNENIVFQNDENFTLYNIKSKQIIYQLKKDKYLQQKDLSQFSVSFINYDKMLVLASEQIILLNIADINKTELIGVIQDKITSVHPKTSSKYLASKVGENSIQITDMIKRKFIKSIKINIPCDSNLKDLVILQNDSKVAYILDKQFIVKNLIDDKIENNYCDTKDCDKIAISKDRKNLIFSSGNQIYYYEKINHQEFNKLEESIQFLNFSFSSDSKYLAGFGTNKKIYFWNFKARKVMAKFQGHSEKVNVVQISQDNSTLASCDDKSVRLWNLNANFNRIAQDGHENNISNIIFSADSLVLYSGGALDQTIILWDIQNKARIISKTFDQPITSFSITHNQECLIITQGGIIQFWNIQFNQVFQKSKFEIKPGGCYSNNLKIKGKIQQIQFLSNDKQFITLSQFTNKQQTNQEQYFSLAEIWERQDQIDEQAILYEYDEIEIGLYQISQDFKYICSLDSQNELTLGELFLESKPNLKKLKQYNNDKIINLLFSNDSKILSSVDSQIVVFRILDCDKLLCSLNINIQPDNFFQYFTDDDKFYYTQFQNQIYLWDVNHLVKDQNFQISQLELDLKNVDIHYFAISHHLKHLVIGLNDSQNNNILRVVELNSMKILQNIHQNSKIQLLLFSDDDMLLAVANELNEILIYEIDQFSIKHSFQCHQAQILKIQFFFYQEPYEIENNNEPQQIDNLDEEINQTKTIEQQILDGQPNQIQNIKEKKKNIIYKSILSLISFDKDYSIVINYLDNINTQNQALQLPNRSDSEIQQVVFTKDIQTLAVITYHKNKNFQCVIYNWIQNKYNQKEKISDCQIGDFCFDQNYFVYCNQRAELYLLNLQKSQEIKINMNITYSNEPFNFLKISSKSIVFAGNNQYMFCWKCCKEEYNVQLILLKKIEYNNFNYSSMFLRLDFQIFCLNNNKIINLDFLNTVEKLKSCLIYNSGHWDKFLFTDCSFSSDLSLCVSVGNNAVTRVQDKLLILWNVRTLKHQTFWHTKTEYRQEFKENGKKQLSVVTEIFTAVAVFIPHKKIIISNNEGNIQFRDCQDFDSIKIIETLKNENKIENLLVSKDGKLLISICKVGIFKLWNISKINQITLQRVIYYEKELVHYRFTKDMCCYSLYQRKGEKKYYLEQLNLTKYPVIYIFQSLQFFIAFTVMQQETIIAFGGEQLVLWNYKSNQNKIIIENNNELFSQIVFGNNINNLAAAKGCIIYLIKEVTEALNYTSISELKGHQSEIVCLSILHDNQMIVSGSQDKTIRFWSIQQLATVYILKGFIEIISKITLSPNCKDMAVALEDGSIRLFELKFPENIHEVKLDEINNQSDYVHCYKVFGRQCLISAKNCILSDTVIEQGGKSLEALFLQKAAKKEDMKVSIINNK
ncbi:unnamed protein product [Paramecium pentaurelia]|uniref:NACHT domain-containing protein n=1 Tax=Paramecium pentaurelia TaxID=43138 RepID=A0A8S1VSV6_9CILI|nr:unnamed protein product [Paramecium pentaurelia]